MVIVASRAALVVTAGFCLVRASADSPVASPAEVAHYEQVIREHILHDYPGMFREKGGSLEYPFIAPGSQQYADVLWDWDSWLSDVALRQALTEGGPRADPAKAAPYERGCILNFLSYGGMDGYIPINLHRNGGNRVQLLRNVNIYDTNMHKPCLAQHAAFLVQLDHGNAEWLREELYYLETFVDKYRNHQRSRTTGIYYWNDDAAIGVDNDPCTYRRPPKSSGSIYLNCLMYKELLAMAYLCDRLNESEIGVEYRADAEDLKSSIQKHCWDERDGFYYSVDLDLLPLTIPPGGGPSMPLHAGFPPDYDCLIQRIDVWSGFLAMWAEIATPAQAERMVREHLRNAATFNAPYGIRTLSKLEKMYNVRASGNPSLWTGPIWGISNYLVFRGLVKYGYKDDARDLAEKTIVLFGRDLDRSGVLHEYYLPDSGEPVLNGGFQNWNYLVLNMMAWVDGRDCLTEF